jgi:hypothetical protein
VDDNAYKSPLVQSSSAVRKRPSFWKWVAATIGGLIVVGLVLPIVPAGRNVPPHVTVRALILLTSLGFSAGGLSTWLLISLFSKVYRHQ